MKKLTLVLCISIVFLPACFTSPGAEIPTPLPTAVPPADAPGNPSNWAIGFTHSFSADFWGEGLHRYAYTIHCPFLIEDDFQGEWHTFEVTQETPVQLNEIYLRLNGLSYEPLAPVYLPSATIHPSQPTVAAVYIVGIAEQAAHLAGSNCEVLIAWDDRPPQALSAGEPFQP